MKLFRKFLFVVGFILLAIGSSNVIVGNSNYNWSKTTGVIVTSKNHNQGAAPPKYNGYKRAEIEYQYYVNEKKYKNNKVKTGYLSFTPSKKGYRFIDTYPLNKEVVVYYDPNNPTQSALVNGYDSTFYIMFIGSGLIFIIVGVFFNIILRVFLGK